jgi:hypothetical protein
MKSSEVKRFAALYERHLKLLKLQGKSDSTCSAYSRAVRRIRDHLPLNVVLSGLIVCVRSLQWLKPPAIRPDPFGIPVTIKFCLISNYI